MEKNKIIFDVHSHVQFPAYDDDREAVIERAKTANVKIIAVGTQVSTSEAGIKLAQKYPKDIWAAAGYHPNHVAANGWHHDLKEQKETEPEKFDIEKLKVLARDPKVLAIGECGLDYYRLAISDERLATSVKEKQKEVFLEQVKLAQELQKPLMIHCRPSKGTGDAYEDLLSLISNYKFPITKIMHFYVGSSEITRKMAGAGFYFSFGGVITFARDYDESIKYIPLEQILLETDCPYVAPASHRGKRNEPAYIIETAKKMAELKNLSLDNFLDKLYNNSRTIFPIE